MTGLLSKNNRRSGCFCLQHLNEQGKHKRPRQIQMPKWRELINEQSGLFAPAALYPRLPLYRSRSFFCERGRHTPPPASRMQNWYYRNCRPLAGGKSVCPFRTEEKTPSGNAKSGIRKTQIPDITNVFPSFLVYSSFNGWEGSRSCFFTVAGGCFFGAR